MGVHGLTTYLRENKRVLSRTLQLSHNTLKSASRIPLVVDAWSFIYEIVYCADLPWVQGGEYPQFARLIEHVVRAWVDVGLELHFVFDGPYPALKFPTLVSRITKTNIQSGLLFFRTSAPARSAPRFLHETAMLPTLAYSVCVDTLLRLATSAAGSGQDVRGALSVHFADEEGDPYGVTLAGRLGAYVAGRDSDFVVLNVEGYRGYVPLDEMIWTATASFTAPQGDPEGSVYSVSVEGVGDAESVAGSGWGEGEGDEDGFQTVKKGKGRKKRAIGVLGHSQSQRAGRGILPPSALPQSLETHIGGKLALSFTVYRPVVLATHLGIPVSLLPLLGALLGNDFTGVGTSDDSGPPPATTAEIRSKGRANLQRLFFERQLTLAQRITRVAGTLAGILAATLGTSSNGAGAGAGAGKQKGKRTIGSVMELIDAAVTALLVRPLDTFATGEREAIVERIAEATLQYAIPKVAESEAVLHAEDRNGTSGLRWVSEVCPLHVPEACSLFDELSRLVRTRCAALELAGEDKLELPPDDPLGIVRLRYISAYRKGLLDPHILDTLHTGTMWPRMFLEDPDKECVLRSVGRPIRLWTYAVLDAGVGLPISPELEEGEKEGEEEDEDGDELIDVVEDSSDEEEDASPVPDPLARLRGALKELDGSEDEDGDANKEEALRATSLAALPPPDIQKKVVTEYVRRGTRLVPEEVSIPSLDESLAEASLEPPTDPRTNARLPPQVWPNDLRRVLLLRALASDSATVSALPDDRLLGVLAVRWVVQTMNSRWKENPGVKERLLERWTEAEAKAVLACFSDGNNTSHVTDGSDEKKEQVPVMERHVQLVAQVMAALDAIEQLSQVLLLSSTISSPARRFSGMRCHERLSGRMMLPPGEPGVDVWQACFKGLEDAYALPPQKRTKEKKKASAVAAAVAGGGGKTQKEAAKGGMFAFLADAEA